MDLADRERVLKLARMLESSYEQERATAAAKIFEIAKRYKLTLPEAIAAASGKVTVQTPPWQAQPKPSTQAHYRRQQQPRPQPQPKAAPSGFGVKVRSFADERNENLRKLDAIVRYNEDNQFPLFNEWEQTFIADVAQRYELDNELSDKQLMVVFRILKKAERYGVPGVTV